MSNLFETDDDLARGDDRGLFDNPAETDELADDEYADEPPDRIEINDQLFMRSGAEPIYTNIEDPDDDRIFEIDPETGELCQWPDGD